ncbi:expressed unknown protein [Seminavis robusta]|uniref:Uncharacterized protein n=1 Tax=Seminavis robusta TaxID=568900 RepID=A0A9N8DXQ7_9STRA|nr:expressed unknown protein [Seminavis robusta]|eukprot:Sro449_g145410.1 n/a (296) ;mRNA; f:61362-62337
MTTEEEADKPGNLDSSSHNTEHDQTLHEQKEEEQQENEEESQSMWADAKQSIAYPAAKNCRKNQSFEVEIHQLNHQPQDTGTQEDSSACRATTTTASDDNNDTTHQGTSAILTAEKRHITYPRRHTAHAHVAAPSARSQETQVASSTSRATTTIVSADATTQGTSDILTAEKRHISYPRSDTAHGRVASPSAVSTTEEQEEQVESHIGGSGDTHRIGQADNNVFQDIYGIMPLPPLERSTANRRDQAQPGAYASGEFQETEENLETAEMTHIEPTTTVPPTVEPENENSEAEKQE